jgi:hypothetical protein
MTKEFEHCLTALFLTFTLCMIIVGATGIIQNLSPILAYGICLCIGVLMLMALTTAYILTQCFGRVSPRNLFDV